MKAVRYMILGVLAMVATACLRDPEAPMNKPEEPTLSVDQLSVTRVSMAVNGTFSSHMADITAYGVELSETLFAGGGTYKTLVPEVVEPDGSFTVGVTGLSSNQTYYLRAFISNGHSKMYSEIVTQKTPETSVATVSDVTLTDGFYLTATIEDNGGREVTDVGFMWSDISEPMAIRRERRNPAVLSADGKTFTLPKSAMGVGTYHVLAYAEDNKYGTGFSRVSQEVSLREDDDVEIEDPNFRQYLLTYHNLNHDDKISYGELKVVSSIAVSTDNIASVREVSGMPDLKTLQVKGSRARSGRLTQLPLSNDKLMSINCSGNNLTALDLSHVFLLDNLDCSGNRLKSLSVSDNVRLDRLNASDNELESIDLSNISGLRYVDLSRNNLRELDMSKFIAIRELNCLENPMDVLYLSIKQEFDLLQVPDGTRIVYVDAEDQPLHPTKYLTFVSEGTTRLSLANNGENAPVLYYSTDAENWTAWDYSAISFTRQAPLYLCGMNPNGFSAGASRFSLFTATGDRFSISGDIMSLIKNDGDVSVIPSEGCFHFLFYGCSYLTAAPELPATTLAASCYQYMFADCTGLTSAPALPATTLQNSCYNNMFAGCTGLREAPQLPATTLVYRCYYNMFSGCTNLSYVKCAATDISANMCVDSWLNNVAREGTFVKPASMSAWPIGASGIPQGWVIVNEGGTPAGGNEGTTGEEWD